MKRLIGVLAFVCAALYAGSMLADRVVPSYTLVPVTAADCSSISVQRQSDGAGGTVIVETFVFDTKDSAGVVRGSVSVSTQLTPAQRSTLGTHITNVGVPLANAAANL